MTAHVTQAKIRVLDLFSGIGGFSLGLERTGGFETVAFCEIEPFPRKVLAKHWPGVPIYEDVRTLTADTLARDGIAVDVITGGFPCQDLSVAGKQAGLGEGARSGLWSEIVRLIGELRPRYVIVENVANLLSGPSQKRGGWFGRVLGDLAEVGYDAEWHGISAANIGARHIRDRVWILAYPMCVGQFHSGSSQAAACHIERDFEASQRSRGAVTGPVVSGSQVFPHAKCVGQPKSWRPKEQMRPATEGDWKAGRFVDDSGWGVEPDVGRVAHGVPDGMDRLAGLGNAVVPQIPELIGRAILQAEKQP
jgi:DNA (cytosine-5)-methyltransferase 1